MPLPGSFAPACNADQLERLWPDCNNNLVFYQCTGLNVVAERPCAPATVFSFQHQVCVHPENFTVSDYCRFFGEVPQTGPLPENQWPISENDINQGWLGNPSLYGPACSQEQLPHLYPDCQSNLVFYQCTALGAFRQMPCAPATVFSFQHQVCVHPENFTVSDYCRAFHPQHPVGDLPGSCHCNNPNPGGDWPTNVNTRPACSADQLERLWPECNNNLVFYQCTGLGVAAERPCAPATVFSFQHQVCVHPENFTVSDYCRTFGQNKDVPHYDPIPTWPEHNPQIPAVEALPEWEVPAWPEHEVPAWPEHEVPAWPEFEVPALPESEVPAWPEFEHPHYPQVPTWPEQHPHFPAVEALPEFEFNHNAADREPQRPAVEALPEHEIQIVETNEKPEVDFLDIEYKPPTIV